MLTSQEKNWIQGTHFHWFILLSDRVQISRRALSELCIRSYDGIKS